MFSDISIHAAQEGCDIFPTLCLLWAEIISIHAAQEGCDRILLASIRPSWNFNPRSPRGLRQKVFLFVIMPLVFQSTQPKRAATQICKFVLCFIQISIHAAQEGCDSLRQAFQLQKFYISIHAAQEGCDGVAKRQRKRERTLFQSTQPKRAATLSYKVRRN